MKTLAREYAGGRFVKRSRGLQIVAVVIIGFLVTGDCLGDTFKHRESGEIFHGFATQKVIRNETRVYVAEEKKFKPLNLNDYDVTVDGQGRRDNVIVIPLHLAETLISKVVTTNISKTISDASNKGPQFILIEIDLPGGRGDYMRDVCETITATTNCPVIAYITGGKFGGAYSASAAIALACDKIYISPGAAIGSEAPVLARGMDEVAIDQYQQTYSSKSLAVYKNFAASLADRNARPRVLAMALFDTDTEVVEVADSNGKKFFIDQADKIPTQVLVKTWTKSTVKEITAEDNNPAEMVVRENTLVLSAEEAVYSKMADGIADSRKDVLARMDAVDGRLVRSAVIDKSIAKFLLNRRQIEKLFISVTDLEHRSVLLSKELDKIIEQRSRGTETRTQLSTRNNRDPRLKGSDRRNRTGEVDQVMIYQAANEGRLMEDMSFVLSNLTRNYRQLLGLARRYPGALPLNVTVAILERRADAAQVKLDNLGRFQGGMRSRR